MSEPITIRRLIDRITTGDIRIPAFQRDFVWEPEQVAFLLDSIYKGFPIGTVILWKTDTRLNTEKRLGQFELPEPRKDYPVNYVLDGQQRLTSLFSVFQTELTPISNEWVDIYFDMFAEESMQESVFVPLDGSEVDDMRHFPVKVLFDPVAYRSATNKLGNDQILKLDDLQSRFKEYLIPNEVFESEDRNKVAIVFERINRAGTELDVFELLSAWSWSDDFDLVDKFRNLADQISEHKFDDLVGDKDLQLRICAGVIRGETTPQVIMSLQGEEIRGSFHKIQAGILGALDFLRNELKVMHYKMIPFPGLLVPLSAFFATDKADGIAYTALQRDKICKWFWRSLFTRRFSAGVNQRQATDIQELLKLRDDENYLPKYPSVDLKIDFAKSPFSSASANGRVLILLLNSMSPRSFLSGASISLDEVLKKGSKHEYHHIFPQKHLERLGYDRSQINVLANICFLTRSDNVRIKDKDPKDYLFGISQGILDEYMDSALCPRNTKDLDYSRFITERTILLNSKAYELMEL
ncbi:DUF262 domain-containing protein [Vibrio cholerae]|uniref:DUF262 domain-containing protein n=1 Tax=Vibrio cholerae TaxID=666 RepID=UPI0018F08B7A|nr:DUF262 domain-containing protein [Vibrio cholerae]EGQ9437946.1 DUF262 domain-containing protein [Vibrio cholerae]MBJ6939710.1 DUF262 domain-containing protein [Vibrio cholerae]